MNIEFYYPVLIVQGEILDISLTKTSIKLASAQHVQYRRSSFVGRNETTYQIDVVTEKHFPKYLKYVESEMAKTARLLRRRHKIVRGAIEKIVRAARRVKSSEKMRKVMDFVS